MISSERLVQALNTSATWRAWWQRSGLQELTLYGHFGRGPHLERVSRGRATAEVWIGLSHSHDLGDGAPEQAAADLRAGLSRIADYLQLGELPEFNSPAAEK